jgi:carbamate kinase
MKLVIALGGNALLHRGEVMSAQNQLQNMDHVAMSLGRLCANHHVAIVHGNGPQIGLLALTAQAYTEQPAYPLDVLGAESQGMIGYIITQALGNALHALGAPQATPQSRRVACLLTQTLVDAKDAAFKKPSKPIGPFYPKDQAAMLSAKGWQFVTDGDAIRRVVASPKPIAIVEFALIKQLFDAGVITVCTGGGGIPVQISENKDLIGIEAVVDKDFSAALLAEELDADRLVILTDVDAVYLDWGTPQQRAIASIQVEALSAHQFANGSMGPKVAAACSFVRETGKTAAIGSLNDAEAVFAGTAGTQIYL